MNKRWPIEFELFCCRCKIVQRGSFAHVCKVEGEFVEMEQTNGIEIENQIVKDLVCFTTSSALLNKGQPLALFATHDKKKEQKK